MGRPRKEPGEKMVSLTINLKQKTVELIAKEGPPKKIIEAILNERFKPEKE